MNIQHFYDKDTATFSYVVSDPASKQCAVIDPVMDYDMASGRASYASADTLIAYVKQQGFTVQWILETHVHADHLSAARYIKASLGGKIGIGERVKDVLSYWIPLFNIANDTPPDGSQFDYLFADGETFAIGSMSVRVLFTPGHTPACVSYIIGDAAFVGDALLMPEMGTGRTDFPGGSAKTHYQSLQKLFALPDSARVFICHDYPTEGRPAQCVATVAQQKASNIMAHVGVSEQEYITERNAKDVGKAVPRLLLPSLQVNLRAGDFGTPQSNGVQYIKIPVNKL